MIKYNLQYFADGPGGEKTEQPTSKKREDARKEGQVVKSPEINTAATFIFMFGGLRIFLPYIYNNMISVFNYAFGLYNSNEDLTDVSYASSLIAYIFLKIILICLPIFAVAIAVGIIINLLQVKWKPTAKPLKPNFKRLSPISGAKKLFSLNSIIELVKSLLKITIIGLIIYNRIMKEIGTIVNLYFFSAGELIAKMFSVAIDIGLRVGLFFILVAILDYAYKKYEHEKKLKMTKQEVKEEFKQQEGNPEIKGKIKQKMREVSMRRMMQELPSADVIITNPTHFAVAVKYDGEKSAAPMVIGKGADLIAAKIKAIAAENKIEIVENKPLARTLYYTVDIGDEIPPELYQAVAEVLAFVYSLKQKN